MLWSVPCSLCVTSVLLSACVGVVTIWILGLFCEFWVWFGSGVAILSTLGVCVFGLRYGFGFGLL